MEQPIRILQAGNDPSEGLCAEVLRCEGFPWFDERSAGAFDGVPPGVSWWLWPVLALTEGPPSGWQRRCPGVCR